MTNEPVVVVPTALARAPFFIRGLAVVACTAMLPGCFWVTTKKEGAAMRHDLQTLNEKVETDLLTKLEAQREAFEEATKLLKRNSADFGDELRTTGEQLRTMRGQLAKGDQATAELVDAIKAQEAKVAAMEARLNVLEGKSPTGASLTAEDLWAAGKLAFEAKKFAEAREHYRKLAQTFPTHDRADDAIYFRGEAYYREDDFDSSIREYRRVFDMFPASPLADDALFRAGEAAEKLKSCSEARTYFGLILDKYPASTLAKRASELGTALKAAAKDKARCKPPAAG